MQMVTSSTPCSKAGEKAAALRLIRKLLKDQGTAPRVSVPATAAR